MASSISDSVQQMRATEPAAQEPDRFTQKEIAGFSAKKRQAIEHAQKIHEHQVMFDGMCDRDETHRTELDRLRKIEVELRGLCMRRWFLRWIGALGAFSTGAGAFVVSVWPFKTEPVIFAVGAVLASIGILIQAVLLLVG
ncbi:MAG: hypothetical protein IT432_15050 [Phycisphaerales bacterium]|nr:hypothetical protein [Phycisphaerales bacterium]